MISCPQCTFLRAWFQHHHIRHIQNVKARMSANFGRRLYAHFWDAANPFLGRTRGNRLVASNTAPMKVYNSVFANNRRLSTFSGKSTYLTRKSASDGLLILGVTPSSVAAENSPTCIVTTKNIAAHYKWSRALHTSNGSTHEKRHSDKSLSSNDEFSHSIDRSPSQVSHSSKPPQEPRQSTYSNRHLMDRLPHMPHLHRPTKEELLAAATGFWSRLKVRFKWFSIRSVRPFNLDEITALFSWVLLGHVVWVVVGTTTFFSLLILAINTVFAQGMCDLSQARTGC